MNPSPSPAPRPALRAELMARRAAFVASPACAAAAAALTQHLVRLLAALEPECLGLYWPWRSEFNAVEALAADGTLAKWPICLPFAQRSPVRMHFRTWDGRAPLETDACGIPTGSGAPAQPDVVLVPCVGYTADGYRLGYGGGYFDRWQAQHPDVTTVGVAWRVGAIAAGDFEPAAHDAPLTLVVTELGVA